MSAIAVPARRRSALPAGAGHLLGQVGAHLFLVVVITVVLVELIDAVLIVVPLTGERLEDVQQPPGDVASRVVLAPLQERPGPATVFGRGGATATDAAWIDAPRRQRQDLLDPDVVLPVVGEVVLVQEALADAQPESSQPHAARVDVAVVSVLAPLDHEAMEVLAAPAQRDLQGGMQVGDRAVAADEQPAPDQRADPA